MHVNGRTSMDKARALMQHGHRRIMGRPREQRDKPTEPHTCACPTQHPNATCKECRRADRGMEPRP